MNETNTMDITAILRAADVASKQNDRYLFVALLIMTIIASFLMWRYLTSLIADGRQDQIRYEESLKELVIREQDVIKELTVVLTKNTDKLEQRIDQMDQQTNTLKDLRIAIDDLVRLQRQHQ